MSAKSQRRASLPSRRPKALTIVVKLGTSSICDEKTHLPRLALLENLVKTIVQLRENGHKVVLVTSGAIGIGLKTMEMQSRPKKISKLQALAGIGQCRLMSLYDGLFAQYGVPVAQVLLSRGDITDRAHYLNACNTFRELLSFSTAVTPASNTASLSTDRHVLPIVNENDAVSVSEIKFGDNDTLSAIVAGMVQAHWLFLLTDVDCLYTDNPRIYPDRAQPVVLVRNIEELRAKVSVTSSGSSLGTGGMATKLIAAELANAAGANVVVSHALKTDEIIRIIDRHYNSDLMSNSSNGNGIEMAAVGETEVWGTTFLAQERPMDDRKWWILHGLKTRGVIVVDRGAYIALTHKASLFSAGVVGVKGTFSASQAVEIHVALYHPGRRRSITEESDDIAEAIEMDVSAETIAIGRGIANYSAVELRQMAGKKSEEIAQILGYEETECVIHRGSVVARSMPTLERRRLIEVRVRQEIKLHGNEHDSERLEFLYRLAETQLENLTIQAQHLNSLNATIIPIDIYTSKEHLSQQPLWAHKSKERDRDRAILRETVKAKLLAK